jgi:tetratricopeptide (TPR) repeat protein
MIRQLYPEEDQWSADLETIVGSLLPQNANEVETVRTILIRLSGRAESPPLLPFNALRGLFDRALNAGMRDSAVLHHLALLLMAKEEFEGAGKYLSEAIAVLDDAHELSHFKSASRQHLHNSMGMVAAKYGLYLERTGREADAGVQFLKGHEYFKAARLGQFPNSYPYYSEAWMSYSRARNSLGTARIELLATALQVLDESEGNVAQDETASLQEMEAKIVQYLGTIPGLAPMLSGLGDGGSVAARYLQARLAAGLYSDGYDAKSAYSIVTAALEKTPNHVACLRLAARLYKKINQGDWEGLWTLLRRRYDLEGASGGCGLLFDLGYTACELGKYRDAAKFFEELDVQSIGHPLRSGMLQVVKDASEPRRFSGVIRSVKSRFEAWIRSDTIGQDVKCVPLRQKFTIAAGQGVTFSLALNYIGLLAIDLRPA